MKKLNIKNKNHQQRLTSVSLLVTEDCNLACKYCYEVNSTGHKNLVMTEDVARQTVEFLFEEAKLSQEQDNHINISFFGGEPTLNVDIIDFVCDLGRYKSKENNIKFTCGMITNATNMNKKIYDIIKKNNDIFNSCQLSVDGIKDIHDKYRVYKSGKGSFNIINKNIPYWKELFKDNLNVHGVLNKNSISYLYESYIFFRETWDIKRIWFLPAKDPEFTLCDVEIYKTQLGKIYDYILSSKNPQQEIEYYAPLDRALKNNQQRSKPCGAGNRYATITADGEIFPCHHIYFIDPKKETKIGDIFTPYNPMKKLLWDAYDDIDMIGCKDCAHTTCYRCIAENYEKFGSPFTQIKDIHCGFMLVDLYYQNKIKEYLKSGGK